LETAARSCTTPPGAADEAAPVPSAAELSAAGVAPAVPACDAFDGLVAWLLAPAVVESAAEEPVAEEPVADEPASCASDEEGSAAGVVAALFFAPPEPAVFRFDEEPVWEEAPVVVVLFDPPAGACVPAAGVEAACFAGVCVDDGAPWLRLPPTGELVRERKKEPPPCESLARSAGDAFASEEELDGETRAAIGMPTLFIVMLAS
jgi:hypothetical protein